MAVETTVFPMHVSLYVSIYIKHHLGYPNDVTNRKLWKYLGRNIALIIEHVFNEIGI
jgi:hypothetical protein